MRKPYANKRSTGSGSVSVQAVGPQVQKPWALRRINLLLAAPLILLLLIYGGQQLVSAGWEWSWEQRQFLERPLYPIMLMGRAGAIDGRGERIVPLRYEEVSDFKDGRLKFRADGRYGYLGRNGEIIIEANYLDASDFSEGLAAVRETNQWKFIDRSGRTVFTMPEQVVKVSPFVGGAAILFGLRYAEHQAVIAALGYLNRDGTVIELPYEQIGAFSEGLAAVYDGSLWGYINKSGELVVDLKFSQASPYQEGLAVVLYEGEYRYIDHRGQLYDTIGFSYAEVFSEGVARVRRSTDTAIVWINKDFEILEVVGYNIRSSFQGKYAYVQGDEGQHGLLDQQNNVITLPATQQRTQFVSLEKVQDLWRLILSQGSDRYLAYLDHEGQFIYGLQRM